MTDPQTTPVPTENHFNGEIYGGLLLNVSSTTPFQPLTFPFDETVRVRRGNHVQKYDPVAVKSFDFWHGGRNCATRDMVVAERGITLCGNMLGSNSESVLRSTMHNLLTVNSGVRLEDRDNMLETVTNHVLPKITMPAFISIEMQSSQPKFILFSRDMPIYMNVFCDDASYLLVWTNDSNIERSMRQHYSNRFAIYRMNPIINAVCVLHTYYRKKKFGRWRYELRDRLKVLNALEALISRRSKSDSSPEADD
jgi:hypothetical protein